MPDVLSNIMLLDAFGFFEIFVGAWRLYIFARRETNSRGGTDPVSLLNYPSSRRLSSLYCGSFLSKLLVS